MRGMLILLALLLGLSATGCGLTLPTLGYTIRAAGMTTDMLLLSYAGFSVLAHSMPYPRAVRAELLLRGFMCNPEGCYQPNPIPE